MGMGGVNIVMPGSGEVLDLFGEGFASLVVLREKGTVISLSPRMEYSTREEFGYSNYELKAGAWGKDGTYYYFWITPYDAFMVRPSYTYSSYQHAGNSGNVGTDFAGGRLDYGHDFGNGITGGLMLEYQLSYMKWNNYSGLVLVPVDAYTITFEDVDEHKDTSKFAAYSIDLNYKLSDEALIAISCGSVMPVNLVKPGMKNNEIYDMQYLTQFNLYDGYFGSGVISGDTISIDYNYETSGYNLNLGAQYIKKSSLELLASAGVILGYRKIFRTVSETAGASQQTTETGTGYNAALKCRMYLGDNVILGAMAKGNGVDYSYKFEPDIVPAREGVDTSFYSEFSAGAAFIAGDFKIPLELFGYAKNGPGIFDKYGGIRGGAQWDAAEWLSLRVGGSWPFLTTPVDYWIVKGAFDITGGAGISVGNLQINLGILYDYMEQESVNTLFRFYETKLEGILKISYAM